MEVRFVCAGHHSVGVDGRDSRLLSRAPEQGVEVAVEGREEFVHVEHVVDADGVADRFGIRFDFDDLTLVLDAQLTESGARFVGITVTDQRGDKVASLAIDALHDHHPNIGFTRENVDIVGAETSVTNSTTIHSLQDYPFNLSL